MTESAISGNARSNTKAEANGRAGGAAPWFGNIAIVSGVLTVPLLIMLGVWADAGLGGMTGGLRMQTIGQSSIVAQAGSPPALSRIGAAAFPPGQNSR